MENILPNLVKACLSDLVQALKMAEELSIWAGLPLYGIGYGIAIWVVACGLGKLHEVAVSWVKSIKEWRGPEK